jgi:hypothetical protein
MKTERTHPFKITNKEAEDVLKILEMKEPLIDRLKRLSLMKIGQGFRNDIKQIIRAAEKR